MLISRLLALGIVITLGLSVIGALSVSSHTTQDAQSFQRGRDADLARWVAIGEAYSQREVDNMQRARDADLARWVAMGEAYTQRELDNMQRARDADLARWVAMGEAYKQRIPSDGQ
jgi:hypothetical protein